MAPNNRFRKFLGGIAAAVALAFVAAPAATAAPDDDKQVSSKSYTKKKDTGWG